MANYYGMTRTNYFKVTNEDAFVELVGRCATDDCEGVDVWTNVAEDGTKRYGFGCYGDIDGLCDENDDYDYDAFIKELQNLIPEGEAVIITHVGHEKLRYLCGSVTVITGNDVKYDDLSSLGIVTAREMLGNSAWTTKNEY